MIETDWFQDRQVDESEQKSTWIDVVIEILCMACLGVLLALAIPGGA